MEFVKPLYVVICSHMQSYAVICSHMQSYVVSFFGISATCYLCKYKTPPYKCCTILLSMVQRVHLYKYYPYWLISFWHTPGGTLQFVCQKNTWSAPFSYYYFICKKKFVKRALFILLLLYARWLVFTSRNDKSRWWIQSVFM